MRILIKNRPEKDCEGCEDIEVRKNLARENLCKRCLKLENTRAWNERNPGNNAKRSKEWRDAGNTTIRSDEYKKNEAACKKQRYAEDPEYREKRKKVAYASRDRHLIEFKERVKKYNKKHLEELRNYRAKYYRELRKTDLEFRQKCLDAQTLYRHKNWKPIENSSGWIRSIDSQIIDASFLPRLRAWQDERCYICNRLITNMWVEHIIPRKIGGPSIQQNIAYSCPSCNESRQEKLLYLEWNPEIREGHNNPLVRYKTIGKILIENNISAEQLDDFSWKIESMNGVKKLFIISSFQASERNIGLNKPIKEIAKYGEGNNIILLDREWYIRQSACINLIKSKLGIAERNFGARELKIEEISQESANIFLEENHIMGTVNARYRIGLINDGVIWGVGLFANRDEGNYFECVRLAFRGHVPGGMSKIIKFFRFKYGNNPLLTFIDSRYANGAGHNTIGFEHLDWVPENYVWVFPDKIQHQRYLSNYNKCSRNLLYYNPNFSREENIKTNGIFKLWLAPKRKMILK